MSPPLKPWEVNSRAQRAPNPSGLVPQSSFPNPGTPSLRIQGVTAMPPPLPPRPHVNTSSVYGSGYSPIHSYSMYGGYGGYSGYGGGYSGYGGGYGGLGGYGTASYGYGGGYGMPFRGGYNGRSLDDPESRFRQMAEESSRPAFQSIDSIVRTFASVTMMLESTFHAMQTSFHAVLGVAENFDRLRQLSVQVAKYMSALAMIRTIYWFYRRLLYMLGLIKNHPSNEDLWNSAERALVGNVKNDQPASIIRSSWPIVTFFGLLFGGPFVIYKLISSIKGSDKDDSNWDPRTHESKEVIMMHKFRAASEKELSVEAGERLRIPTAKFNKFHNSGWILAVNQNNRIGLVPMNYLISVNKKQSLAGLPEITASGKSAEGNKNLVSVSVNTNDSENQNCENVNDNKADISSVMLNIEKSSDKEIEGSKKEEEEEKTN